MVLFDPRLIQNPLGVLLVEMGRIGRLREFKSLKMGRIALESNESYIYL